MAGKLNTKKQPKPPPVRDEDWDEFVAREPKMQREKAPPAPRGER